MSTTPTAQRLTLSFLSQPLRGEDLSSAVACLTLCVFTSVDFAGFFFWDILCWNNISVTFPSFPLARIFRMPREQLLCLGNGGKKCGAFMSTLLRDPHPTCARCRGRRCFDDMTCDICKDWSVTQWEKFHCKCSYSERCKNCPSGSIPSASKTSPPVPPASAEAWPPLSLSLPLPPPHAPPLLPPLAHTVGERGGDAGSVVAGTGAVSADPSLTECVCVGGGGGGSAEIPPSQHSMVARSPPLPGPSELLVHDSWSRLRNSGGLRRECTLSRSPRASWSSSPSISNLLSS